MEKKILIVLIVALLAGFITGAVETLGTFQQGKEINLLQAGANFSFCNITSVLYPNSSSIFQDVQMTKRGNEYNYTLLGDYTATLGSYIVNGFCSNGTSDIVWAYDFEVTPNGEKITTGQSILYIFLTLIFFGLILMFFYFIVVMPKENEVDNSGEFKIIKLKYLRILFIAIIYPLIIILLNMLNGLAVNFSTLSMFSGILGFLFETMLRGAWFFTIVIILWVIYKGVQDSNVKKHARNLGRFKFDE